MDWYLVLFHSNRLPKALSTTNLTHPFINSICEAPNCHLMVLYIGS